MSGGLQPRHTVVTFHLEVGLIIPVSGLDKDGILFKVVSLQDHTVTTISNSEYVSLSIFEKS